jgi:hypothetical protein
MSEVRTISDVVMTSIQAEDSGVVVNWKQTCLQLVNSAQQEFNRLAATIKELEDSILEKEE